MSHYFTTQIPLPTRVGTIDTRQATDKDAFSLQEALHHEHAIEVPVKCLEGRLYVRISAHVYNTIDEYRRLGKAIKSFV